MLRDMNLLGDMDTQKPNDRAIGESGYTFIDGDTIRNDEGKSIRIDGINTPEVAHERDVYSDEPFKGTVAGPVVTSELATLAKSKGFTEVVESGEEGAYGRGIGDLINPETGEKFSVWTVRNGLAPITKYSSNEHQYAYQQGLAERMSGTQDPDAALARSRIMQENVKAANAQGGGIWKDKAYNEEQYARDSDQYSGVQIRHFDRNLQNEANDQWSTSFDTSLIGMTDAYFGFKQMLGAMTDNADMQRKGEEGSARARYRMRLNPTTTVDMDDVEGVGDFVDYIANNAAMSVPYMATTMASAAGGTLAGGIAGGMMGGPVGAAAGTAGGFAVGLTAPWALYSGQVYNEQEVKDVKAASISGFAQALLDRVGLAGIKAAGGVGLSGTLKEATEALVKSGMTNEAATKLVTKSSRNIISEYMDDAAGFAKQQISARNVSREVITRFTKGFGSEAVTEAMQEAAAYAGANHDKENWGVHEEGVFADAMLERMGKAAMAGGMLGGTFGTLGAAKNRAGWADTAYNYSDSEQSRTAEDKWAEDAEARGDMSHEDFLRSMKDNGGDAATDVPFRTQNYLKSEADKSKLDKSLGVLFSVPRLWRGQMRSNFDREVLEKSPNARRIWGMLGGALNKVHAGKTFEDAKTMNNQKLVQMSGNPSRLSKGYKGILRDSKAEEAFSEDFYRISALKVAHDEAQRAKQKRGEPMSAWDWAGVTPEERRMFNPIFRNLEDTSNYMLNSQNRAWKSGLVGVGDKFKKTDNYLLKFKAMNKPMIENNRDEFISILEKEHGFPRKEANDLVNKMLEGEAETGHSDDVFSMLTKGFHPSAAKKRTIGLSNNPAFRKFFHQSMTRNLGESFKSAARFEAYHDYVGKDKWKINQLLQGMIDDGVSDAEVNKVAFNLERYFQAESGNYKRPPKGSRGDRMLTVQKSLLTWSLLTALPLSAFSSIVELALTMKAMTQTQVFGDNGLKNMGYEVGRMFVRGGSRVVDEMWTGNQRLDTTAVGELLDQLGYNTQEAGAATTTGATEVSELRSVWIENFFKYNGLQGLTNTTRAIRAGMANDFMLNHFETIIKATTIGETNAVRQSKQQLRDLGIDVPRVMVLLQEEANAISQFGLDNKVNGPLKLSIEDQAFLKETMDLATYTFINDAVALPGSANRPLIYQDPRFSMLTQFNGYVSTVQANMLPKMWMDYVKRGSPEMKYNTFMMMGTMIALGFASQYLKDWLKHGKGENEYLDNMGLLRRAVNSSGLLGTSERALSMVFPMYDSPKSENGIEKILSTALGEAPALSPVGRLTTAATQMYEGNYDDAKYNALRATPGLGPMTQLSKFLSGS